MLELKKQVATKPQTIALDCQICNQKRIAKANTSCLPDYLAISLLKN